MSRYYLEFILCINDASAETIKNAIMEFGDNLKITDCDEDALKGKSFKIHINAEDPTIIFDTCAEFGRIKSVRIEEGG